MPSEVTPETVRSADFRTVMRGADTSAVKQFLDEVAGALEELQRDRDRLVSRLGEFADRDLKSEFENVGREVTTVLEAAREAAETMRERATADAARWRSESMAEAEQLRKEAKNDAEALRSDAWAVGSELLNQVVAEARNLRESAERDAITIAGEAERDAHRLVSGARREAEDMLRAASMDAEKITAEAEKSRDNMLATASKQAEASQERTRALEQRREELMEELEGVRAALHQMEGTLEAKREDLNLSRIGDTSVRVIPGNRPAETVPEPQVTWQPGETVRIIRDEHEKPVSQEPPRADPVPAPPIGTVPAKTLEPDAEELPPVAEPEPPSPPVAAEPETVPPAAPKPADDVGALFESLRRPGERGTGDGSPAVTSPERAASATLPGPQADPVPEPQPEPVRSPEPSIRSADDLIEERDGALLPITNRALRGIKKAVTEAQNVALDGLRTDSDWEPDRSAIAETLRADLITLWAESYTAGHDRAQAMAGARLKRPSTPITDSPEVFGTDLVQSLKEQLSSSSDGQRERQSAASKVFRAWRTDEAERRVRALALTGFHRGFAESAAGRSVEWIASGTPCSACRQAALDPTTALPPVHPGCECTLAL
ncbi:MAG: DivIVA domain-containing protein [Acidimicrobiia bacterium]